MVNTRGKFGKPGLGFEGRLGGDTETVITSCLRLVTLFVVCSERLT